MPVYTNQTKNTATWTQVSAPGLASYLLLENGDKLLKESDSGFIVLEGLVSGTTWAQQTKNTTSYAQQTKNTTSFSSVTKNTASWANETKN